MNTPTASTALGALAEAFGVDTGYLDTEGRHRDADPEALSAVLALLGAQLDGPGGAAEALRARRAEHWGRPLEPVTVAWEGQGTAVLRGDPSAPPDELHLAVDGGEDRVLRLRLPPPDRLEEVDGRPRAQWRVPLPRLPTGVHRSS